MGQPRSGSGDDGGADGAFADDFTRPSGLAEGTIEADRPAARARFRVVIHYREPEFEARIAPRDKPFRWTYRLEARDQDGAAAAAIREFHETARQSSVGWRRDIVAVVAEADTEDPAR